MLKKSLLYLNLILMMAFTAVVVSCDDEDEKRLQFSELPQNAQQFIETYFGGTEVSRVIRDKDDGRTTYEVWLADGTEIDFLESGEWQNIDCRFSILPDGILPATIAADIDTRYPDAAIHGAEKQLGGIVVDLTRTDGTPLNVRYSSAGDYIGESVDY